jgi:hypothetical protein
MTGFTSTVASKGTTIIADWIRMGLTLRAFALTKTWIFDLTVSLPL